MSAEPTTPHPCTHFAVNVLKECHQRNLSLPPYTRFFLREDCPQICKGVFEACEKVAEQTQSFTKPYIVTPSEK
jgi:hypothetical protein